MFRVVTGTKKRPFADIAPKVSCAHTTATARNQMPDRKSRVALRHRKASEKVRKSQGHPVTQAAAADLVRRVGSRGLRSVPGGGAAPSIQSTIPLRPPAHEATAGFLISAAINRATDRIEKVLRQAHGLVDLAEMVDNLQTEIAQLRSENEELRALMDENSDVPPQEEDLPQEDASQESAPAQEEPKTETPDDGGPVDQPEG